jgi:hypothetical protein
LTHSGKQINFDNESVLYGQKILTVIIHYSCMAKKRKPKTLDGKVKSDLFPGEDRRKSFKTLAREELEKAGILAPKKNLKNKKKL